MSSQTHEYRRRRRFVDKMIQGQLLWGLIVIETLLFTVGMLVIYNDLQSVVQDSIYRIHQDANDGRSLLFKELMLIFPWIITVNLFLIILVDRRWKRVVRHIILQLQDMLYRVKRLDLRIYLIQQTDHHVLQQAKLWLDKERDRNTRLQRHINELPVKIDSANLSDVHKLRENLKAMSRLLPSG